MTFYDFDSQSALEEIKRRHQSIKEIKEKLADVRDKFRAFCSEIELDKSILFNCIDVYERTLLIDCYTFSEQLTKSLIYHLLNKDNNSNVYIETFIDKKINPEKFSPNVRFENLEKAIRDVYNEFKFILKNISEIEVYNELVKSRHRYAHKGSYDFEFANFTEVIDMLEYITFEFKLIQNAEFDRGRFICHLDKFERDINGIIKDTNRQNMTEYKKELNLFFYNNLYLDMLLNNKLLERKINELEEKLASLGLGLSNDEKEIFYILKRDNNLTIEEICLESKISEETNLKILNCLITKDIIEKVEREDNCTYIIKDE